MGDRVMVFAPAPQLTVTVEQVGDRPELYDVLTRRFGDERDPRTARFSAEPVAL